MTKEVKISTSQIDSRLEELYLVRNELIELWQKTKSEETPVVTAQDVASIVSAMTGIPLTEITEAEREKLIQLESRLASAVIGQDPAIGFLAQAIRRARSGLKSVDRPVGTFLFLGPTGVGKSLLANNLADALYGSDEALIRIDMSEFMERHTVSRLVGAPPGYVGYDEGGQLTEMVRRHPFSVILFDEIEKAHHEVFNLLLQIMEDGRLTDGQGRLIDFKNTVIIMTSNAGSEFIDSGTLGFSLTPKDPNLNSEQETMILTEIKRVLRPEFINRIDEIIVFNHLMKADLKKITLLELENLKDRIAPLQIKLKIGKKVVDHLVEKGYDPHYGARPIKRLIQKEIENILSDEIVRGNFSPSDVVVVKVEENTIKLSKVINAR